MERGINAFNARYFKRLAIGNDLAYYWHTRNLDKALALANKYFGLASLNDVIGQGRLQVTLAAIMLRKENWTQHFLYWNPPKPGLPKRVVTFINIRRI